MKSKSPLRAKATAPATPISQTANPADEIPPNLEYFKENTPAQFLGEIFSPAPETIEVMAGLASGIGFDAGITIPQFAKEASKQFWKYFVGADFSPTESFEDMGVVAGVLECRLKQPLPEPLVKFENIFKAFVPLLDYLEKMVRAASPEETAKFYVGRARASKVVEKMKTPDYLKMVKLAPIYATVSQCWKRFEKFGSQADAERWLRSEKVISDNVDSREVRAVFARIGLRPRGPGRPKKL